MTDDTPVRQQYLDIKKQFPHAIVFFRLGDFYETFDQDAEIASRELDIVLTSRNVSKSRRVPMAGVPFHAAEGYIARLIEKGYHVAVVEQVGEEPVNGLMPRDVVRIVTPGTITEPALLPEKRNNYLAALAVEEGRDGTIIRAGFAYADISTGEFAATELTGEDVLALASQEIARIGPRELLLPEHLADGRQLRLSQEHLHLSPFPTWRFDPGTAAQTLMRHFQVSDLAAFELAETPLAAAAAGAVLAYLYETQRGSVRQIGSVRRYSSEDSMVLDAASRRNLELIETIRDRSRRGSLFSVLDRTVTAMGGRLLAQWIGRPLLDLRQLNARLDTIETLFVDGVLRGQVSDLLRQLGDLERLANRALAGSAGPREVLRLLDTLRTIPALRALLISQAQPLREIAGRIDPLEALADLIERAIDENAPASLRDSGVIRAGYSPELDAIIQGSAEARLYINSLETVERERTKIKTLKVGYNKVFGYYIEVTRANSDVVPPEYIRKQTLVNAERYITPEMKDAEVRLLHAEEQIQAIEQQLYRELLGEIGAHGESLLATARALAYLDVSCALAEVAARNGYVRPRLTTEDMLEIRGGRHPVVELSLHGDRFVPNDTSFAKGQRLHLITGPNMAGKSTYLRQVALIVLMAQIGCFVPADEAVIGVVDRIFTRIGAQDEIHAGQSTFMVEMIETAVILQQSTRRSLIILDEVGRGTSTYDGLAIARAVVEYLHNHPRMGGKTLFATHYHELTELETILPGVSNYNVQVAEEGDQVVFLHSIAPGRADKSYGIHVAQLAGVPKGVVSRAAEILETLEAQGNVWQIEPVDDAPRSRQENAGQLSFLRPGSHPLIEELRAMKVEEMSPIDAITRLYELQRKASSAED